MLLTPELVRDIPVVGLGLAGNVLATLDIARLRLLSADAEATDLGTCCATHDGATDRGNILTASAPDLVAEHATDHRADERPGNADFASILSDLFLLDPA